MTTMVFTETVVAIFQCIRQAATRVSAVSLRLGPVKDYQVPAGVSSSGHSRGGWANHLSCRTCALAIMCSGVLSCVGCHSAARPPETRINHLDATEGDILCRPGGGFWGVKGSQAILIVASGTCGSCQADLPFEERLSNSAREHAIPVYYVLANRESNRGRIKELRSGGRNVIAVQSLQQFGIARVPTVARVDASGRILSSWTGNVQGKDFDRVLDSILRGAGLQEYQRISQDEMRKRVAAAHTQVIAFSETRDLSVPAKIIPPGQVYVRARREMNPDQGTIIDCTRVHDTLSCQDAALELTMANFRDVAVAGLDGRHTSPCGGGRQ